jgi:hypothetical protein
LRLNNFADVGNKFWRKSFQLTEGRTNMAKTIKWEKEFDHALTLAQAENKMVLLDFFNPL